MLFKKKKTPQPDVFYIYTQSEHYRGFKRIKLSSYGHQPAMDGIRALDGVALDGSEIRIAIFEDEFPRANVIIGNHEVGTIWKHSFDRFNDLKNGRIERIRVEIRDGDAYLFYK